MSRGVAGRIADRAVAGRGRTQARDGHRGQSLVEFALVLPVLLLLTLIAIDFGRIYLGWINLQNMARIGANFASNNAADMDGNKATTVTQYRNQINSDASASNCPLAPGQPANPTFTDMDGDNRKTGIGDRVSVTLVCRFHVITPLIAFIVGSDLNVTTTSVFPVKQALAETSSGGGGGGGCLPPTAGINATPGTTGTAPLTVTFRDASGGGAPTTWVWTFKDSTGADVFPSNPNQDPGALVFTTPGTYTVSLTASNACGGTTTNPGVTITVTPTNPPPTCTVPDFNGVKRNSAQAMWGTPKPPGAGFTTTVQDGAGHPNGNYTIKSQSIVANTTVPCSSTITVNNP